MTKISKYIPERKNRKQHKAEIPRQMRNQKLASGSGLRKFVYERQF